MGDKEKAELRKNGFIIFSNAQFIITLAIILVTFLIGIGGGIQRFATAEKQIEQNSKDIDNVFVLYQQSAVSQAVIIERLENVVQRLEKLK